MVVVRHGVLNIMMREPYVSVLRADTMTACYACAACCETARIREGGRADIGYHGTACGAPLGIWRNLEGEIPDRGPRALNQVRELLFRFATPSDSRINICAEQAEHCRLATKIKALVRECRSNWLSLKGVSALSVCMVIDSLGQFDLYLHQWPACSFASSTTARVVAMMRRPRCCLAAQQPQQAALQAAASAR